MTVGPGADNAPGLSEPPIPGAPATAVNLKQVLDGAPALQQTPGLAVGLAQGLPAANQPVANAGGAGASGVGLGQAAGLALTIHGAQQASAGMKPSPQGTGGQSKGFWHWLAHGASDGLNLLNRPLQDVQHIYRYFHDVWERHGAIPALAELGVVVGLGALTGGIGDAALGMGLSAAVATGTLASEGASELMRHIAYPDSWKATANPNYRDLHTHQLVSPGQDLANLVDHLLHGRNYTPNKGVDVGTGLPNAVFDLTFDPLMKVGSLAKAGRAEGILVKGERGVNVLGHKIGVGNVPRLLVDQGDQGAASDMYEVYANNPGVQHAVARIAGMDTAQILREYPMFRNSGFAAALGSARTSEEVLHVFGTAINARNYSFLRDGLPVTSITRRAAGNLGFDLPTKAGIGNWIRDRGAGDLKFNGHTITSKSLPGAPIQVPWARGNSVTGPAWTVYGHLMNKLTSRQPFSFDENLLSLASHEADPNDPNFVQPLYQVLLHSQTAEQANQIVAKYVQADTLGEKLNIIKNAYLDAFRASGIMDETPIVSKYASNLNYLIKQAGHNVYGVDRSGNPIVWTDKAGNPINRGILVNQVGKIALPNFREWKQAIWDYKGGIVRDEAGRLSKTATAQFRKDLAKRGRSYSNIARVYSAMVRGGDVIDHQVTTRFFKKLVLLSMGFATRVSAGELIPAMLSTSAREVIGSGLLTAAVKLNPQDVMGLIPKGVRDDANPLLGVRAQIDNVPEVGYVKQVDRAKKRVLISHPSGQEIWANTKNVSFYHRDLTTEDIQRIARELKIQVDPAEVPHIKAAMGKAMYGMGHALVDSDARDVPLMTMLKTQGHLVVPAVDSGHIKPHGFDGISENIREAAQQAAMAVPHGRVGVPEAWQQFKDTFDIFHSEDQYHPIHWQMALKEAQKDPGIVEAAKAYAKVYRRTKDEAAARLAAMNADTAWIESDHPMAVKARYDMAHYARSPQEYSVIRNQALEGLFYGHDSQKLNLRLMERFANGEMPTMVDLARVPFKDRPWVKGREIGVPASPPSLLDRAVQKPWKVIHATINSLSRAPIYNTYVTQEYKFYKPWIDAGIISKSEAHDIAMVRAMHRMLPNIHNTLLRSQMALAFRNVYPFYFAQEQAYRRYLLAAFHDPLAFREATLGLHALIGSGAIQTDGQGNHYIVYPGEGDLATLMTVAFNHLPGFAKVFAGTLSGVPAMISGDTISLRSVVPEMNGPSTSPMVAVPLKALASTFHQTATGVNDFLGNVSANSSMLDEMVPNVTLRRLFEAFPAPVTQQAFMSTYATNAAWAAHRALALWNEAEKIDPNSMNPYYPRNQLDPKAQKILAEADNFIPLPGASRGAIMEAQYRLKHTTTIMMLTKAVLGAIDPLSPVMQTGDIKIKQQIQQYITKYGITQGLQNYVNGIPTVRNGRIEYVNAHPDATPDTVFESTSNVGTSLPATKTALDWLNKNWGWVQKNPLIAAQLMPQDPGVYNSQAYQEELAAHLRQRRTPDQFLQAIYTAEGNSQYIPALNEYEQLKGAYQGDSQMINQLYNQFQAYIQNLAATNPYWYDSEFAADKYTTALQAYNELQQTIKSGDHPPSNLVPVARDLIHSFQDFQNQMVLIQAGESAYTKGQFKNLYYDYLDQVVAENPVAKGMAYGIFRKMASAE